MNLITAGRSYPVARYTVRTAEIGGWCAEAEIAAELAPGPCVLGGWAGTIREVRQAGPIAHLDIRAGDDALDRPTEARQWAATLPAQAVADTLAREAGTLATAPGLVATWRSYGRPLRDEIARLARWLAGGAWYVDEVTGAVTIGARTSGALAAPGRLTDAGATWRGYSLDPGAELTVLVGRDIDGHRVERAVFQWSGQGPPSVDLFAPHAAPAVPVGVLMGGTVEADTEDRATIRLDSGTVIGDVPLWFIPGVRCAVAKGTRVLVADLGGDPRAPIAFAAPFDSVPASDVGTAIREGDVIMMPFGSAGTPTPTPIAFGPGAGSSFGPPGAGKSRIKL